jgi:hypothetical protein
MDHLQQLEIECPFCGETQPRETARWDEGGLGYTTICPTCGKVFSGMTWSLRTSARSNPLLRLRLNGRRVTSGRYRKPPDSHRRLVVVGDDV